MFLLRRMTSTEGGDSPSCFREAILEHHSAQAAIPHYLYAASIALTVFSVLLMELAIMRKLVSAASYPL